MQTKQPVLRTMLGGLVENAIFLEMQQGKNFLTELSGWRKSAGEGVEVDLILKVDKKTIPIEVKCGDKVDKRKLPGIRYYLEKTGQKFGVIVSTAPYEEVKIDDETIVNLPVYLATKDFISGLDLI